MSEKKVLVRWNMPHVMSVGTGMPDSSGLQFIPGINEFTKEQWALVCKHPTVIERMEKEVVDQKRGLVKMIELIVSEENTEENGTKGEDNNEDNGESSFSSLGATEAKTLIKETFNTTLLKEWKESETRSTVVAVIDKQLEIIENERIEKETKE